MRLLGTAIGVIGLGMGLGLVWLMSGESPRTPMLVLNRGGETEADAIRQAVTAESSKVVLDDLRRKYDPPKRVEFRVCTTQDTSIFVLATGIQFRTASGWKCEAEEYRGEIWRLKAGIPREVCVQRSPSETWRAYVKYGIEMKGPPLLRAQLREAWILRSFSNWTGKPWGGGRWSGSYELFSEEVTE